ncbi:hypothetical protein [Actibacterium sp. XHP0104]|uniref:hypothetical protein n=1 Tax=Actibacterium sp. XHP0104 TaxID=2984335 RepID=UPI0021E7E075|nr:hypothetical protein [Actibacterium sp. XHP0104]MCV2881627.1 hypothetical protein [Actibacterium sp. XHP0104]
MTDILPKEVLEGLELARKMAMNKKSRMRVQAGADSYRILRYWSRGFVLDAQTAPHLRGLVDIYDGAQHLYQALIVASAEEGDELVFEFKRRTPTCDRPPLDYYRDPQAPIALLR